MKQVIISLLALAVLFSCGGDVEVESYKPKAMGQQGEIIVVMPTTLWEGQIGGLVKERIAEEIQYYPQTEYLFDLRQSSKGTFNKSQKDYKNILELELLPNKEMEAGVNYSKNIWANGQAVVKVSGHTQQELAQVFSDNSQAIQDHFMKREIERIQLQVDMNKNYLVEKELTDKHNFSLTVPLEMEIAINKESFVALERKRLRSSDGTQPGDIQQYILAYYYPYTSDSTFTKDFQIAKRDSILKKYLKGVAEDSYMITAPDSLAPTFDRERLFKGNYAYELRGLYSMKNDFRGGPFISVSLVDERRNRVITIEGNLFSPKFKKREFMMELETIINSLSLY